MKGLFIICLVTICTKGSKAHSWQMLRDNPLLRENWLTNELCQMEDADVWPQRHVVDKMLVEKCSMMLGSQFVSATASSAGKLTNACWFHDGSGFSKLNYCNYHRSHLGQNMSPLFLDETKFSQIAIKQLSVRCLRPGPA